MAINPMNNVSFNSISKIKQPKSIIDYAALAGDARNAGLGALSEGVQGFMEQKDKEIAAQKEEERWRQRKVLETQWDIVNEAAGSIAPASSARAGGRPAGAVCRL